MLKCSALHLAGGVKYSLHPVVVFSILDHHKRRKKDQERVIGTLLGSQVSPGVIEITNSFPVPHDETPKSPFLFEAEYFQSMLKLHGSVNSDEVVVGWYTTGGKVDKLADSLYAVFKDKDVTATGRPTLITVDTELANWELGIRAFNPRNIRGVCTHFEPAQLDLVTFEAEKIGIDALINGAPSSQALDAPATILSDFENLTVSMSRLLNLLDKVGQYASAVAKGEIKEDVELGRQVAMALSAVPHVHRKEFNEMFNSNVQDLLMVVYLSKLTKTQLALADKINGLLD